eukprot:1825141-Pyramimonas_sp.AAC.1
MVYFILARITTAHVGAPMRIWVDDLYQRVTGSRKVVRAQLAGCLRDTCDELSRAGLKAAPKSVLVCSKSSDGKQIAARLSKLGYTVQN